MRRLYYLSPHMQFPFAALLAGMVAAELATLALSFSLVERVCVSLSSDMAIYLRYGTMLLVILFFSVMNILVAMRISHRFAGPIIQILRALQLAQTGNYSSRIIIRKDDHLHEVSHAINCLFENLEAFHPNDEQSKEPTENSLFLAKESPTGLETEESHSKEYLR